MTSMADPDTCATFDARDKLVLRYAETLTRDNKVDDALYRELDAAFSREEIVELAMTVGMSAMVNRVHATFATDVDDDTLAAIADGPACPIGR